MEVVVKVDEKGRILLSKELRKGSGVGKNDLLLAKSLSKGKILLEKPQRQPRRKDPFEWFLTHPAKVRSSYLRNEIKKMKSTEELIEKWKDELWMGK